MADKPKKRKSLIRVPLDKLPKIGSTTPQTVTTQQPRMSLEEARNYGNKVYQQSTGQLPNEQAGAVLPQMGMGDVKIAELKPEPKTKGQTIIENTRYGRKSEGVLFGNGSDTVENPLIETEKTAQDSKSLTITNLIKQDLLKKYETGELQVPFIVESEYAVNKLISPETAREKWGDRLLKFYGVTPSSPTTVSLQNTLNTITGLGNIGKTIWNKSFGKNVPMTDYANYKTEDGFNEVSAFVGGLGIDLALMSSAIGTANQTLKPVITNPAIRDFVSTVLGFNAMNQPQLFDQLQQGKISIPQYLEQTGNTTLMATVFSANPFKLFREYKNNLQGGKFESTIVKPNTTESSLSEFNPKYSKGKSLLYQTAVPGGIDLVSGLFKGEINEEQIFKDMLTNLALTYITEGRLPKTIDVQRVINEVYERWDAFPEPDKTIQTLDQMLDEISRNISEMPVKPQVPSLLDRSLKLNVPEKPLGLPNRGEGANRNEGVINLPERMEPTLFKYKPETLLTGRRPKEEVIELPERMMPVLKPQTNLLGYSQISLPESKMFAKLNDAMISVKSSLEILSKYDGELKAKEKELTNPKLTIEETDALLKGVDKLEKGKLKLQERIDSKMNEADLVQEELNKITSENIVEPSETGIEKELKSLREKINRPNMTFGIDAIPEVYKIGLHYMQKGFKSFNQWSKQMIANIGEKIKPMLKNIWEEITNPYAIRELKKKGIDIVPQGISFDTLEQVRQEAKPIEQRTVPRYDTSKIKTGDTKAGKPEPNLNTINPEIQEEALKILNDNPDLKNRLKRERISDRQAIAKAVAKAQTLTDRDIAKLKTGTAMNIEDFLAYKIYVDNKTKQFVEFADQFTPAERLTQAGSIAENFLKVEAVSSEAARTIRGRQLIPKLPLDIMRSLDEIIRPYDKETANYLRDKVEKIAVENDPTVKDKLMYWWYNALLSNPVTHVRNILGNVTNLSYNLMLEGMSNPRNIPQILRGLREAMPLIKEDVKRVTRRDSDIDTKFMDSNKYEYKGRLKPLLPLTWLSVEDVVFRRFAETVERKIQSKNFSKENNVSPETVETLLKDIESGKDISKSEYAEQLYKIADEISDFGKYIVFQTPLGKVGQGLQNASNNSLMLKYIMPFIRTPANILKAGLEPLKVIKFASPEFREQYKNMSQRERTLLGNRVVGMSMIWSGLFQAVASGFLEVSGQGSQNPVERQYLEALGWQPNSIKLGNKWISYQNLNPLNTMLAVVGNTADYYKYNIKPKDEELEGTQQISTLLANIGASITDQSFLSGLSDFFKWMSEKDENYLNNALLTLIPNVVSTPKDIKKYVTGEKPVMYETTGIVDQLKKKVGLTEGMTPKLNVFGDERRSNYETLPVPKREQVAELESLLLKHKINIGQPRMPAGMTQQQFWEFRKESGQTIRKILTEPTNWELIKKYDADGNTAMLDAEIDRVVSNVRNEIKEKVLGQDKTKPIKRDYQLKTGFEKQRQSSRIR